MTDPQLLIDQEVFYGKSKSELTKLTLQATQLEYKDNSWASTVIFSIHLTGGIVERNEISANSVFDCLNIIMGNFRGWLEFILGGSPGDSFFISRYGELEKGSINDLFYTHDCITSEIEDKLEFAESKGYHDDWRDEIVPDASGDYTLEIFSDFGQFQIYDRNVDATEFEPLEWDDKSVGEFATFSNGVLGFGVIENEDIRLKVNIHESEPPVNLKSFAHIMDAPFTSISGVVEIADKPIVLPAGDYVARWFIRKAKKGNNYKLDFWPGKINSVIVKKQGKFETDKDLQETNVRIRENKTGKS